MHFKMHSFMTLATFKKAGLTREPHFAQSLLLPPVFVLRINESLMFSSVSLLDILELFFCQPPQQVTVNTVFSYIFLY